MKDLWTTGERDRGSGAAVQGPGIGGWGLGAGEKVGDDRRYPKRPLVGVGAIILRRDRILMAQRGKEPLKGWWSLPGGALEIGESLKDAVCREIREETGLEIRPLSVFEIFERIIRDAAGAPEYHYVLIDYLCRITGGTLAAGDDVCRVEWVRRRDLPGLLITEGTLGVIERAFDSRPNSTARQPVSGAGDFRPTGGRSAICSRWIQAFCHRQAMATRVLHRCAGGNRCATWCCLLSFRCRSTPKRPKPANQSSIRFSPRSGNCGWRLNARRCWALARNLP